MSVCGQNGQVEEENVTDDTVATPVRDSYKQKPVSKVVRVLTVLAYLLSVSLAAILLSVYYVCVWKSPELPLLNNTGETNSRISNFNGYSPTDANIIGGTNTSIDAVVTQPSATATTLDLTNAEEVFVSNTTLIPTAPTDSKQSDSNNTLHNIGTNNDTGNIT